MALAQAHEFAGRLAAAHQIDRSSIEIVVIRTSGDAIQDRALSEAGGKGLFTKELDVALTRGEVDAAVHSAKDLPTRLPDEIAIAGYLPREDPRDAWISPHAPHPLALPAGGVVGTASLRRAAMLKRLRPDLSIALLRGNVETRLAKLAAGEVAGTLLALAGLKRLGLQDRVTALLDPREFVPAAGQGAIAVTARTGDETTQHALAPVFDAATGVALAAERAFLHMLDGSCKTPIGAHARIETGEVVFHGVALTPDGSQVFETFARGPVGEAAALGAAAGSDLLARLPEGFFRG